MKKLIINILWFFLDKLSPAEFIKTDFDTNQIIITVGKKFYRKNEWTHFCGAVAGWIKKTPETQIISEVMVFKGGELYKQTLGEVYKKNENAWTFN